MGEKRQLLPDNDEIDVRLKEYRKGFRAGPFIISVLVIYYVVFGIICNTFDKYPGYNLLFIYLNMFNAESWTAILVFTIVGVFQAFKEDFLVYSIKNNLMLVPVTVLMSIIWFDINYETVWDGFVMYFTNIHGYINILVLTLIMFGTGNLGGYLRIKYREYMEKQKAISIQMVNLKSEEGK